MLADETCWFLAADFDKATWRDDAAAFLQACAARGVPAALERSRSGEDRMPLRNVTLSWYLFASIDDL
jgi:hypothetical protein